MGSLEKLRMQWRMLFRRGQERQRLDDEVSFHVEELTAENVAAGMDPAAARHAALQDFGNPMLVREQTSDAWAWSSLEVAAQNLRIGARTLARTPGFAAIAILIIAIGIGANLALFTVVRSVILRPLPFKEPGRLVRLYEHSSDDKFPYNVVAPGVFAEWKKQSHSFSGLAILSSEAEYNLSGAGQLPEKVAAAECSWTLFPTVGVKPALGRGFTAEDDQPSAVATVILSWGLWQRRFGGDLSILKQTVNLDSKPYAVIGIMPAWFAYPDQAVQLWTPIYHEESPGDMQKLDSHSFLAVGRLRPGVSEGEARAELSLVVGRLHDEHRDNPFVSKSAEIRPLLEDVVGDVKKPLYVLLAATGCLLFIACLNVASLLVARGAARRKELAIRTALGSSRWRLLGDQLTESFILSAAGGALGLLMAYGAIQWFVSARPDMSRIQAIHMDGIVLGFALGLIFLCTIFSAIASSTSNNEQLLPSLQESLPLAQHGPRTGASAQMAAIAGSRTHCRIADRGGLAAQELRAPAIGGFGLRHRERAYHAVQSARGELRPTGTTDEFFPDAAGTRPCAAGSAKRGAGPIGSGARLWRRRRLCHRGTPSVAAWAVAVCDQSLGGSRLFCCPGHSVFAGTYVRG